MTRKELSICILCLQAVNPLTVRRRKYDIEGHIAKRHLKERKWFANN